MDVSPVLHSVPSPAGAPSLPRIYLKSKHRPEYTTGMAPNMPVQKNRDPTADSLQVPELTVLQDSVLLSLVRASVLLLMLTVLTIYTGRGSVRSHIL